MDDTTATGPELPIRLVKSQGLIAQSLYRPGSSEIVVPVGGSSKHYILMLCNGSLRALVGIAFIDRSDAIDFSFLLHEFSRRYVEPKQPVERKKRTPLELAFANQTSQLGQQEQNEQDDSDESEFGDFQ